MDVLNIAGLSLALEATPLGPLLSTKDPKVEPLAWVINSAVTPHGHLTDLADCLECGDEIVVPGLYVGRPDPLEDMTVNRLRWRELTGSDPGEDCYVVGTSFIPECLLVPRQVLQVILSELLALRQQYQSVATNELFRSFSQQKNQTEA